MVFYIELNIKINIIKKPLKWDEHFLSLEFNIFKIEICLLLDKLTKTCLNNDK